MNNSDILKELETSISYEFINKKLLIEAFSHPSLKKAHEKNFISYERFELLGDAIISFLVVEILLNEYEDHNEGEIAKLKAHLVSKEMLSKIALDLNLGRFLIMSEGEDNCGGRENINNLEDALEALIAAIYLDSGIDNTRKILGTLWQNYIREFNPIEIDPKSTLQEWAQQNKFDIPKYNIIEQEGPAHSPTFKVEVVVDSYSSTASASNIKSAEKQAAKKLLEQIKRDNRL